MNKRPSISIVIVNWRTLKQTQLCLRLLRKHTQYPQFEVIVVENDPADESAAYLRGLPWIRYVENKHAQPDHRNGLDLGISLSQSDYILAMHTDTFVRGPHWLDKLVSRLDEDTAILGSQDRLIRPLPWYLHFDDVRRRRKLERRWKEKGQIPKVVSYCALYRRDLFTTHGQRFGWPEIIEGVYNDCGEILQRFCEKEGLGIVFLRREFLAPLLWHFEAASLNVRRGKPSVRRRIRAWRFYRRKEIRDALMDSSLDA